MLRVSFILFVIAFLILLAATSNIWIAILIPLSGLLSFLFIGWLTASRQQRQAKARAAEASKRFPRSTW